MSFPFFGYFGVAIKATNFIVAAIRIIAQSKLDIWSECCVFSTSLHWRVDSQTKQAAVK